DHPARRAWKGIGLAALAAVVIFFPLQQVDRLDTLKDDIAARDRIQADLHELVTRPGVRRQIRACSRVYVASHRPIPLVALWADMRTARIVVPRVVSSGCILVAANAEVDRLAILDPNEPETSE